MCEFKQCCIQCRFHFFDEKECPNCEAERICREVEREFNCQVAVVSWALGFRVSERKISWLWYSWGEEFKSLVQKLAPDLYDWLMSYDIELAYDDFYDMQMSEENSQLELFEERLPF